MTKPIAGIITYVIIFLVLIFFGIAFYDAVWSFPGNFDFIKDLPTKDLPIGSIPFMVIILVGTGIFITVKLGFPQIKHLWHGVRGYNGYLR